jgi:hypothetical protein
MPMLLCHDIVDVGIPSISMILCYDIVDVGIYTCFVCLIGVLVLYLNGISRLIDVREVERSFCLSRPDGWVVTKISASRSIATKIVASTLRKGVRIFCFYDAL